mgnify:CR=1 FL=1
MLAGRPHEALELYRAALSKDDDLAKEPEFQAKLRTAESRAAHREGLAAAGRKDWAAAVDALNRSLSTDPGFSRAVRSLQEVRVDAARDLHRQALGLADEGRLNEAIEHLRRALEFHPDNADARDALDSVSAAKARRADEAVGDYQDGRSLAGEKRWLRAADRYERAIRLNRNHLPSRAALHEARSALARARGLREEARTLSGQKRLERAADTFRSALDVWPFFDAARSDLRQTVARRERARQALERARKLASGRQWDSAVAAAEQSVDIFPFDPAATSLLATASAEAAEAHWQEGDRLLSAGDLPAAEREFRSALSYVPDMQRAKDGLAAVSGAHGERAASANRWGAAMLWYMEAAEHSPVGGYAARAEQARGHVLRRIAFSAVVEIATRDGVGSHDLESAVSTGLAGRPGFLTLADRGEYRALIEATSFGTRLEEVRRERHKHRYAVQQEVVNPRLRLLADRVARERRELARLIERFNGPCRTCGGDGWRNCPVCRGSGKVGEDRTCRRCGGKGVVWCYACDGSGRQREITKEHIARQRRGVQRAVRGLRLAPRTVIATVWADWPYDEVTVRKTADLTVEVNVRDAEGHTTGRAVVMDASADAEDRTHENPNPAVGVAPDPLELPADADLRREAVRALGPRAGAEAIRALLRARVKSIEGTVNRLARSGDADDAIEAGVDVALTLEPVDSGQSRAVLADLRGSLRP